MRRNPSVFAGIFFSVVGFLLCAQPSWGDQRQSPKPEMTGPSQASISFQASPALASVGATITLTATVKAGAGKTALGSVQFVYHPSPNKTVVFAQARLNKSGIAAATYNTHALTAGSYVISAEYHSLTAGNLSTPTAAIVLTDDVAPPTGNPLSQCADLTKSGTYYLSQDVTSAGTCFFIDADNITLNLNGHTITYGTGGGTGATPGIMLADDWFNGSGYDIAATGTTEKHGGFIVYGGNITSSTAAAPRSAAIWVGQSNDVSPAPVVHDVVMTTYTTDSSPIFGTLSTSGWQIYNNTINYASTTTSSRYDFYGYAIWLGDQPNAPGVVPDNIYSNKIVGAPQGGIFDDHQNAYIHNNDITWNSFYANDYGVIDYNGENQIIANNVIHPTSGRGIDIESANTQVTGNTVTTVELAQVAEYASNGYCEDGGSDGIRIRDNAPDSGNGNDNVTNPTGVVLSGNSVTVTASVCQGNALRLTSLQPNDTVTFTNNSFVSKGGTSSIPDYAISLDGDNQPVLNFTTNAFQSQYAYVQVAWDGANATILSPQTWAGTPGAFVDNQNGYNDPQDGGPTFGQALMIENSSGGSILCGAYAAGTVTVGPDGKTCN